MYAAASVAHDSDVPVAAALWLQAEDLGGLARSVGDASLYVVAKGPRQRCEKIPWDVAIGPGLEHHPHLSARDLVGQCHRRPADEQVTVARVGQPAVGELVSDHPRRLPTLDFDAGAPTQLRTAPLGADYESARELSFDAGAAHSHTRRVALVIDGEHTRAIPQRDVMLRRGRVEQHSRHPRVLDGDARGTAAGDLGVAEQQPFVVGAPKQREPVDGKAAGSAQRREQAKGVEIREHRRVHELSGEATLVGQSRLADQHLQT